MFGHHTTAAAQPYWTSQEQGIGTKEAPLWKNLLPCRLHHVRLYVLGHPYKYPLLSSLRTLHESKFIDLMLKKYYSLSILLSYKEILPSQQSLRFDERILHHLGHPTTSSPAGSYERRNHFHHQPQC